MTNYTKINIGTEDRAELHDKLGLTGAEVSVNRLPAGAGVPFVHSHRRNEEIYGILAGAGRAIIDGENDALCLYPLPQSFSLCLFRELQHRALISTGHQRRVARQGRRRRFMNVFNHIIRQDFLQHRKILNLKAVKQLQMS